MCERLEIVRNYLDHASKRDIERMSKSIEVCVLTLTNWRDYDMKPHRANMSNAVAYVLRNQLMKYGREQ